METQWAIHLGWRMEHCWDHHLGQQWVILWVCYLVSC